MAARRLSVIVKGACQRLWDRGKIQNGAQAETSQDT